MVPKRSRPKTKSDPNQLAASIVAKATEGSGDTEAEPITDKLTTEQISQLMTEMGRRGGRKGGKVRAKNLSAKRRKEISMLGIKARWGDKGKK